MINKIKWFVQRTFRGYSDVDAVNLTSFIVRKNIKPLKAFIRHQEERGMSLPYDFATDPAQWLLVLKKIEYAFDETLLNAIRSDEGTDRRVMEKEEADSIKKRVDEGFELYGRYLLDLWD